MPAKKIKKRGTDVKLDVAKVLVFFFDTLYTLIIVIGQFITKGNLDMKIRLGFFVFLAVAYAVVAVVVTVIITWKAETSKTNLLSGTACYSHCCTRTYEQNEHFRTTSLHKTMRYTVIKKRALFLVELSVIACVGAYFVGDNLNDIEKSRTTSMIIIFGLLGIYFLSYTHTRIKEFNKKKENTRKELIEKGQIETDQLNKHTNNKRNAELIKKIYEFILHIFGLIPFIDGIFTSILEVQEPCEPDSFNNTLWGLLGFIMVILGVYLGVYIFQFLRDITQQEIKVSKMSKSSEIVDGEITNIGGTVTCTYNRRNANIETNNVTNNRANNETNNGANNETNNGANNETNNGANNETNNGANNETNNGANNETNNGANNEVNNGANNEVNNGAIIPTTHINGPCKRIKIEGGTTWSNNQRTICGTKITITGGKHSENKRGGTTIIEEGNITTEGGELIFNNGTVSNKEGRFFNIGGEEIPYQEPNEDNEEPDNEEPGDVHIARKGGITTITGGTTTFTADSATVMGGEVTRPNQNNPEEYKGTRLEKDPRLIKTIVIVAAVANWFCIGLFLIADNSQPFDCVVKENTKLNFGLRVAFLAFSLILYALSIIMATYLWHQSHDPTPEVHDPNQGVHDLPPGGAAYIRTVQRGPSSQNQTSPDSRHTSPPATPGVRTTATPRDLTRPVSDIDIPNPRN